MTGHEGCKDHVSLLMGVCYCPRTAFVYVQPSLVCPEALTSDGASDGELLFFKGVVHACQSVWPRRLFRGFILLARGTMMAGMKMEGVNPDDLPAWNMSNVK